MTTRKKGAPMTAPTVKGADSKSREASVPNAGLSDNRKGSNADAARRADNPPDPGQVLWEQPDGRNLWRFAIRSSFGRPACAELRQWIPGEGGWRPGKRCTLPPKHLPGMIAALTSYGAEAGAGRSHDPLSGS